MTTPFSVAFARDHAFGVIAGVHLPAAKENVAEDVLVRLHPEERAHARALEGFRQAEWVGARLAWQAASERAGVTGAPLLSGSAREPLGPPGVSVSITHKRNLAIVLVASAAHGLVGVDLEDDLQACVRVAARILRPEELHAVDRLPESDRARAILLRFAVKEAVYKAVYPHFLRSIGYAEAQVDVDASGAVAVTMPQAKSLQLEVAIEWMDGPRVIAAVRGPTVG